MRAGERVGAVALRSQAELDAAAAALDAAGWSWRRRGRVLTRLWRMAADAGLATYPFARWRIKSWDVWRAVRQCLAVVPPDGLVFDIGADQSEVLWALSRAGFTRLAGCDTDPRVLRMPGRGRIAYSAADFFAMDLEPGSVNALSCLSVMEHGMDPEALLARAASVLAPEGRLLVTTDYWPERLDTSGVVVYDRPWRVFSRADIEQVMAAARRLGFEPDGPIDLTAADAPIHWSGRHYTFLWLAFAKRA